MYDQPPPINGHHQQPEGFYGQNGHPEHPANANYSYHSQVSDTCYVFTLYRSCKTDDG